MSGQFRKTLEPKKLYVSLFILFLQEPGVESDSDSVSIDIESIVMAN